MVESKLTEISSGTVRSVLYETIEKQLKTKQFELKLTSASKAGDNFIGIVQRVTFNEINESGRSDAEINKSAVILKTAPTNVARRETFKSRPFFLREIYLYDKVLPYFKAFQQSKGVIVEEDGFRQYPLCYKWLDIEPYECLLLEDLKTNDFTMIDRRKETITVDHVNLVMKSIGKFHAISLALRDQQPTKFQEITSNLGELFFGDAKPEFKEYFESLKPTVFASISSPDDSHLTEKVNALFVRTQFDIAAECVRSDLAEPYGVICHADLWTNNTMFKYDEYHKPIEVCLIDWQLSRYASPVTDLLYYLFSCTTKELRDKHYEEFLKTYHQSLSTFLKRLGSDPSKLFPYDVMLEHLHKFGKFALILSVMLLPMVTAEEGTAPNLDDLAASVAENREMNPNVFITENSKDALNKRLRDVIVDMVRLDYL